MCQQDQTLLSHPFFSSNICKNDVSSKSSFAQSFDEKNVGKLWFIESSLNHH